nr:Protein fam49a [Polyrhizophydium stewartii]
MRAAPGILNDLRSYSGCGEAIRQAISNPGKATEDAAWAVVCPAVAKLKDYYDFSCALGKSRPPAPWQAPVVSPTEQLFPRILSFLGNGDASQNFEQSQALARKLAEILDFATQFDNLKAPCNRVGLVLTHLAPPVRTQMSNPNVQNDFSYYRRTVSRMKMNNAQSVAVVSDEVANKMSLFFAHSNPVTKALIDSANVAVMSRTLSLGGATDVFSILAGVSYHMVAKGRAGNDSAFFLRVMVVSVLLYDHIDPAGAFIKNSKINVRALRNHFPTSHRHFRRPARHSPLTPLTPLMPLMPRTQIKASIKVIQSSGGSGADALLNALRFSTQHLNDETTPKAIKQMLAQ